MRLDCLNWNSSIYVEQLKGNVIPIYSPLHLIRIISYVNSRFECCMESLVDAILDFCIIKNSWTRENLK